MTLKNIVYIYVYIYTHTHTHIYIYACHVLIVDFDLSVTLRWEKIRKKAKVTFQVRH